MDYHGRKVVTHGGAYDGMFSRVALVPEENLGFVILTNGTTSVQTALMYRILDTFLDKPEKDWSDIYLKRSQAQSRAEQQKQLNRVNSRVSDTRPSRALTKYTGKYSGSLYGDATIDLEDGHLVLQLNPASSLRGKLSHWHFDTFKLDWDSPFPWFGSGKVQFILDSNGEVVEFVMDVPNDDFWFNELEFKRR